ncbi:uncharacterized protein LOC122278651 [Carya illinoinensis]|uniref:uncharacterized protein LOC122278651 n=1 Tax=Carya illinoinensis TaxID=32201 RepID=UPI001C721A56|nr:uncharacterized protein LOC122278651 [Carya illinoinensis]
MVEELDLLYASLSLTEKENEEVLVESSMVEEVLAKGKHCLIMCLLTRKHYNHEAFKATMKKVWRPVYGIKFRDLNTVFTLIEFEDEGDKSKVERDGMWHFDKQLILLKPFEGSMQISSIQIKHVAFWVQIHDLPLMAQNYYVGKRVGSMLGEVFEIDLEKGEVEWGEYIRIRVMVDITQPLQRRKWLKIGDGDSCWVRFSYERLPNLCYFCGVLGHTVQECEKSPVGESSEQLQYGEWMRAAFGSNRREGT